MKHEILLAFLVLAAGCIQTANVVKDYPLTVETANKTDANATEPNTENKTTEEQKNETYQTPLAATSTPAHINTPTPTNTPAPTQTPANTPTPSITPTHTPAPTPTPTATPTPEAMPTETATPSLNHIIFTEIFYDTAGTEAKEEWIEIYNPSLNDVNLSGWSIEDNAGSWNFPVMEISPRSYVRIARNSSGFYNATGCQPDISGFSRGLNNDGDQLTLKNNGNEVDFVSWEGGYQNSYSGWNISAAEGKSISRIAIDTDSPAEWSEGETSGC